MNFRSDSILSFDISYIKQLMIVLFFVKKKKFIKIKNAKVPISHV